MSALPSLSDLSNSQVGGLLSARARNVLSDAHSGSYGGDQDWVVQSLVRACATSPAEADWEDVFALLADPSIATRTKHVICAAAARFAGRLPHEVRQRFISCGEEVAQLTPIYPGDSEIGAIHSLLLYELGATSDGEAETALAGHTVGTHLERRDAAHLALALANPTADLVLTMLAHDKDFTVRDHAAYCIGRRVASSDSRTLDRAPLQIAHNDATIPQLSLLNGLKAGNPPRRPVVYEIAEHLMAHPSATVRRRAYAVGSDTPQTQPSQGSAVSVSVMPGSYVGG